MAEQSFSVSSTSKGSSVTVPTASSSSLYARRKLKEEAEAAIFKKHTETEVLEYLYLAKPGYLVQDGSDIWLDYKEVEAKMAAIILKLRIHSYPERADRLKYLQSVLKQKWANKPEKYKAMLTFLTEMYDQPSKDIVLRNTEYSTTVEEDVDDAEFVLFGDELRKAELKKEQFRQEVVNDLMSLRLQVSYSSEEELSEWDLSSDSDDTDEQVVDTRSPVVQSSVEPQQPKLSEAELKRKGVKFWESEADKATLNLRENLHRVEAVPLTDQPVISSLMALYTRFGEHWEWKKASGLHQRPAIMFLSESDIIQELIWQFLSPSSNHSMIFTSDWKLRQEITVKTLSHSALQSFISTFGTLLSKLEKMKNFIRNYTAGDIHCPPIYHTYAHTLSQVLAFITCDLDAIERSLSTQQNSNNGRRPTTLIQLEALIQPMIKLISSLEHLHTQAISVSEITPNWLKALQLISCFEIQLTLISHPPLYGLVLFIFSKCLLTSLDQILRPLEMTDWDNTEFLFMRSTEVKITEPNFWNEIIIPHDIEVEFAKLNLRPLSFLNWILPKVLTMLKVQEIVSQLGTEIGLSAQQLAPPLPSYKIITNEFLEELLGKTDKAAKSVANVQLISNLRRELQGHLAYLGLQDSVISSGFETMLKENPLPSKNFRFEAICEDVESFATIEFVPLMQANHALRKVLEKHMDPYFRYSQNSLVDLFQRYGITNTIRLVQDIIFGGKEEFALACIRLGYQMRVLEQTGQLDDTDNANSKFQNILNMMYPEDRNCFDIEFIFEPNSSTANFGLKILPQFPLTLFLTPKTISRYEYVAKEIFRIRKGLWILNRISPKLCKAATEAELKQLLLIRFAMIHFWASLRSFVLLAVFNPNEDVGFPLKETTADINEFLTVYEDASSAWPLYRILSLKIMDSMIIKPMLHSTLILGKKWKTGIPALEVTSLGLRVKRAWELILELGSSSYSPEMNQIAQFFGPIPEEVF